MGKFIDLTGNRYTRLVVVGRGDNVYGKPWWECNCDCGTTVVVAGRVLREGTTKSCGCYNKEKEKTHGMSYSRFYVIWKAMLRRCKSGTGKSAPYYKSKGIEVCNQWKTFENFRDDMYSKYLMHVDENGVRNTTIDRIEGDEGYHPLNCRWATYEKQSRNRSFKNKTPGVISKKGGKWKAEIGVNNTQIHLGTFSSHKIATEARSDAENKYWRNA